MHAQNRQESLTLTAFLLARIAEDEQAARSAIADDLPGDGGFEVDALRSLHVAESAAANVSRWTPTRVLAECEAKRRIVGIWADGWPHDDDRYTLGWQDAAEIALKALALPYADHPDYDEAWRP